MKYIKIVFYFLFLLSHVSFGQALELPFYLDTVDTHITKFYLLPGGSFSKKMLSKSIVPFSRIDADSVYQVKPFAVAQTPVSVALFDHILQTKDWSAVWKVHLESSWMKENANNCFVYEHVSKSEFWDLIEQFIEKLNAETGKKYRLLSDIEWQYMLHCLDSLGLSIYPKELKPSNEQMSYYHYEGHSLMMGTVNYFFRKIGYTPPNYLGFYFFKFLEVVSTDFDLKIPYFKETEKTKKRYPSAPYMAFPAIFTHHEKRYLMGGYCSIHNVDICGKCIFLSRYNILNTDFFTFRLVVDYE